MKKYRLREQVLIPLTGAIVILVGVLAFSTYYHESKDITNDTMQRLRSVDGLMAVQIRSDSNLLGAVLDSIKGNEALKAAFRARDRNALLRIAGPLSDHLKASHGITHFYFTAPDRTNILRLYAPEKYGDRIDRFTTVTAQKTGKLSYGIELGWRCNLTLRAVEPWYDGNRLLGFIEVGMEIEHTMKQLHEILGVDITLFIDKKRLPHRSDWEEGMKMFGRKPDWDRFDSVVVAYQTSDLFSKESPSRVSARLKAPSGRGEELCCKETRSLCAFFPIHDVGGNRVGTMAVTRDITALARSLRNKTLLLAGIFVLLGGVAFVLCYIYAGRVQRELERSSEEIERLAVTDALTGLYNRRGFIILAEQLLRAAERTKTGVSLIYADVDDMKSINDGLGHLKGDEALVEASQILREVFRKGDIIARTGGDEFAVLASGAPLESSDALRARLQERIDAHNGNGERDFRLSMSFGIVYGEWQSSMDDLMARADILMYEEKRSKQA